MVVPPNPLRSLAFDAAAIRAVVQAIDGPVLLVGHSYGGAVITQASAGLSNLTGLVYLAAFGLDEGESAASVQEPFPPSLLAVNNYATSYDAPGAPQGPELYIKRDKFRETFCADLPVDVAEFMAASQRQAGQPDSDLRSNKGTRARRRPGGRPAAGSGTLPFT